MKSENELSSLNQPDSLLLHRNALAEEIRQIVRQELDILKTFLLSLRIVIPPAMTEMPMYKMNELCQIFRISKPTIYDWIKKGELRPVKIRSRVFFLSTDIRQLVKTKQECRSNPGVND